MSEPAQKTVPLYRCRACGEQYPSDSLPMTATSASIAMALFGRIEVPQSLTLHAIEPHGCRNGTAGLADCIGFRDLQEGA